MPGRRGGISRLKSCLAVGQQAQLKAPAWPGGRTRSWKIFCFKNPRNLKGFYSGVSLNWEEPELWVSAVAQILFPKFAFGRCGTCQLGTSKTLWNLEVKLGEGAGNGEWFSMPQTERSASILLLSWVWICVAAELCHFLQFQIIAAFQPAAVLPVNIISFWLIVLGKYLLVLCASQLLAVCSDPALP